MKLKPLSKLLEVRSVEKKFGSQRVLQGLSLDIYEGEFLTLLGESGSGKTTLLRLIAGFEGLDGGEILLKGTPLHTLPANKRPVNTVFQSYALFPHLSVFENVAYGLRVKGVPNAEVQTRVEAALETVKMTAFLKTPVPKLSGGQQQRIALARAIINRPQVLLLDEPLSALDAGLRSQMQTELKSLQRELGITFLFVTHDQSEAMALSDRIALLKHGKLEQVGTPQEIYHHPATEYVAKFIGRTNLLRGNVQDQEAQWDTFKWRLAKTLNPNVTGEVLLSLRPECIRPVTKEMPKRAPSAIRFTGKIENSVFEGASSLLEARLPNGHVVRIQIPGSPDTGDGTPVEREFEFLPEDAVLIQQTDGQPPSIAKV